MSKIVFRCLLLIILSIFITSNVFAQDITVEANYNAANGVVTLNGYSVGNTIIKTLPFSVSEGSVTSSGQLTDIDQIYCEGNYTYSYPIPVNAPYGKYSVYVKDSMLNSASDTFIYYKYEDAEAVIPLLNSKSTLAEFKSAVLANTGALGIDTDDEFYKSYFSSSVELLFSVFKPFDNSTDFYNGLYSSMVMNAMKGASKAEVESLIELYQYNLGIDYTFDYYTKYNEKQKNDICSLLANADFKAEFSLLKEANKSADFKNCLKNIGALSAIRLSTTWSEILSCFKTGYSSELGYIITNNAKYKSSLETQTFRNLSERAPFSSMRDLRQKFDLSVDYAISQNGGTSSLPHGGSRPSSSVSVSPGFSAPADQFDESNISKDDSQSTTSFNTPVIKGDRAQYLDVSASSWEYNAVSILGGMNIISGYSDNTFKGSNSITRAEFAKLIVSAFNIKSPKIEFSDVNSDDWFYPYVSVAAGIGIIQGYEGRFSPNSPISREDAAVIIYRLSSKIGEEYIGSAVFNDITDVSVYALTAVKSLGFAGIINGDDVMNFNPQKSISRAEAAQLLYNFINKLNN